GRSAARRQLRPIEIARSTPIKVKEVAMIDPLEIEQQRNRLAYVYVGKYCTARIEHEECARLRHPGRQSLLDYASVPRSRKIVRHLPASGVLFIANVIEAAFERFQV